MSITIKRDILKKKPVFRVTFDDDAATEFEVTDRPGPPFSLDLLYTSDSKLSTLRKRAIPKGDDSNIMSLGKLVDMLWAEGRIKGWHMPALRYLGTVKMDPADVVDVFGEQPEQETLSFEEAQVKEFLKAEKGYIFFVMAMLSKSHSAYHDEERAAEKNFFASFGAEPPTSM